MVTVEGVKVGDAGVGAGSVDVMVVLVGIGSGPMTVMGW